MSADHNSFVPAAVAATNATTIEVCDTCARQYCEAWAGEMGPPIPVIVRRSVLDTLIAATFETPDPVNVPRVFRLFMKRGHPREVVDLSEIESVWRNRFGQIRWSEGPYPSRLDPLRKRGNAFIRGDVEIGLADAWWMGREQTDLRLLLALNNGQPILVVGVWARAGASRDLGRHDADGELLPVRLLIE